jgi:uncharacterized protein
MPKFIPYLRTATIGALGGIAGHLLGLPLGWLLGAMIATVPFAIAGVPMPASRSLRSLMIAVVGVMVGGAFTPEIIGRAPEWVLSLSGLAVYIALVTLIGLLLCRKVGRLDRATSAFSSLPGGLSEMLVLGPALGADIRSLSLVHGMRLFIILVTVPVIATSVGIGAAQPTGEIDRSIDFNVALPLGDAAILLICVAAGMMLGRWFRMPAANLTGPLILSAIAHLAQWTSFHPPQLLVIVAQVVIGSSIASFFAGITPKQLLGGLAMGGGMTVISLSLAALFAWGFDYFLDIPFIAAFIAIVPGGLPEMSLISISLGVDPAFVSLHHLFRVAAVLILAPLLIPRWIARDTKD